MENLISIGKHFLYFAPQNPQTDPKQHVCLKEKGQFFIGSVLTDKALASFLVLLWSQDPGKAEGSESTSRTEKRP